MHEVPEGTREQPGSEWRKDLAGSESGNQTAGKAHSVRRGSSRERRGSDALALLWRTSLPLRVCAVNKRGRVHRPDQLETRRSLTAVRSHECTRDEWV